MNGIIIDGKIYEASEITDVMSCDGCDLYDLKEIEGCIYFEMCLFHQCRFRYSQSLTDKLNGK